MSQTAKRAIPTTEVIDGVEYPALRLEDEPTAPVPPAAPATSLPVATPGQERAARRRAREERHADIREEWDMRSEIRQPNATPLELKIGTTWWGPFLVLLSVAAATVLFIFLARLVGIDLLAG